MADDGDGAEGTGTHAADADDEVVIVVSELANEAVEADAGVPAAEAVDRADLQSRWLAAQSTFLDDPAAALDMAHAIVAEAATIRAAQLQEGLGALSEQRFGEGADTESRRQVMRQYRDLFERLV
jgi:hypothetical protein